MLRERYHVETLEVFGSYVRSEQKKDSDYEALSRRIRTSEMLRENLGGLFLQPTLKQALFLEKRLQMFQ
jgi:predicted nucleotidyltransferase